MIQANIGLFLFFGVLMNFEVVDGGNIVFGDLLDVTSIVHVVLK